MMYGVLVLIAAYLIGSVSFAIVIASSQDIDIRSVGSGNPGVSNVLRTLGKKSAALVLVGDALKGVLAAALGTYVVGEPFGWAALFAAMIGHAFPIWHQFRGGKSVATVLGGVIFLAPMAGAILAALWLAVVLVWKTASMASLLAMVLLVPLVLVTGRRSTEVVWAAAIAAFVIIRHAGNIRRLLSGSEGTVA